MDYNSIRTLFVTRYPAYPPVGGSALRNWQNINIMMKFGLVAIISICFEKPSSNPALPPGITICKNYYIDDLKKQRSFWKKIKHRLWKLRPYGHPWHAPFDSDIVAQELSQVLAKFQPNLVVVEELWLYHYFNTIKRYGCPMIYDAHNVELSGARDISISEPNKIDRLMLNKVESIERDFVSKADQIWVCSKEDNRLLQQLYHNTPPIHVVPNGLDIAYYDGVRLGNSELEPTPWSILFTASFQYEPNAAAAQILIDQIYPRLRQNFPNCRLMLVGVKPTRYMREAAKQDPGIVVTGRVPDVRPYLAAASVVVVPLLQGGGSRLKILEAFASHRPVVSTTKGAEGLKVRDGEHLLIADKVDEIVAAVQQLWSEPSLGKKLADSAYELVWAEYSWKVSGQRVEQAVQQLLMT
ncbi:glycosyltransferase family 4 protein [Microseira sp. BLCC-F43]|jgi:glycosyltransferase involved in cell wall biosynthesis|uniref:glycosyltransferase family 4 protein n=1 Tax=Microseira sp. BLCC-F43 TaxID=3153602 RepID=UPI0035B7485F